MNSCNYNLQFIRNLFITTFHIFMTALHFPFYGYINISHQVICMYIYILYGFIDDRRIFIVTRENEKKIRGSSVVSSLFCRYFCWAVKRELLRPFLKPVHCPEIPTLIWFSLHTYINASSIILCIFCHISGTCILHMFLINYKRH